MRGNICTVRGKVVIPSYIYYLCPKTFILVRKHFSLRGNIKSSGGNIFTLRGNLLTMRGNLFTVRGNLCTARKYFQVPVNFFVCARKLLSDFGLPTILGMPSSRD